MIPIWASRRRRRNVKRKRTKTPNIPLFSLCLPQRKVLKMLHRRLKPLSRSKAASQKPSFAR